jgi:hypothetical protein
VLTLRRVDRSSAVRQLPDLHAVAIRLRDEGLSDHVIAVALEIEEAEVPILLHIADSKLTNLMAVDAVPYAGQSRRSARTNTFHANHQEGSS